MDIVLRQRLSEPTFALNVALNGVVEATNTPSVVGTIYWRWEDDPAMEPQFLAEAVAGHTAAVPFDLPVDRPIRLFLISNTDTGRRSTERLTEGEQLVFSRTQVALITAVTFDSMTGDVTIDIANNDGTGDIHILRKIDTADFAEIASVASSATGYVDTPAIDGTYSYKLMQDGLTGESNTESVDVDVSTPGTGSPPTDLSSSYDGVSTITLNWTNHAGTGNNIIEVKIGISGVWGETDFVASGIAAYDYEATPSSTNVLYSFRVRNESVSGYSNQANTIVPRE